MATPDPELLKPRKCKAKSSRSGKQCNRWAINGGYVCYTHGGSTKLAKAKAAERIQDLIDPDRALRTAAALAYADITSLYDEHYKLKPLREWPPELRQAVKRIEPRLANVDPGDGAADAVLRVELHDKVKALEMLFKHLGLLTERVQHGGEVTFKWKGDD
jgi:hypothetical protein